ncbi:MAG: glycosyltransferase family 1 [Acidimicrobiales bacterium]|nr:MAG: glycosyltransferase family 1 [Acidimicrobiales bacterium]
MIATFIYPSTGNVTGGEAVLYEFANALSRRGVEVHFLHGPSWPDRVSSLDEIPAVCRQAEVVHHLVDSVDDSTTPNSDVVFNSAAPARLGLPIVVVQGHRMLSEEWEADAFRSPGLKVCVASWLLRIGASYGVQPDRMVHVPPGLDHELFRPHRPLADRSIDVTVLHHPFREKGWSTALAMLEQLRAERPDIQCTVFGRGVPDTLPEGVDFVDSPDHHRLATEIYSDTRVFVQTSRNEGFGLTPLEAMACGAALVTTDCGGSEDYGLAGRTADVVPVENAPALARAVIALHDDEPRRLAYAQAAVAHARTFDWDAVGARLEAALAAYVADPAPFLVEPGPQKPELR